MQSGRSTPDIRNGPADRFSLRTKTGEDTILTLCLLSYDDGGRRRDSNPQPSDPKEPRPAQQAEPISEEIANAMEPAERVELSDS